MGKIKDEVRDQHLIQFRQEQELLDPFLTGFDVSWGRERKAYNTTLSVYILTCEKHIIDTFGFSSELALFIPHFTSMQDRVFQAINQILSEDPLNGRADRTSFFVICNTESDKRAVFDYVAEKSKNWVPIVLTRQELRAAKAAKWGIRHAIESQIFTRDLFNEVLPLKTDINFFGRENLLFAFKDAIHQAQNKGLFGLRKTGKTSLLFKLMRGVEKENSIFLYYDCKKPRIRQLRYIEFLNLICDDILVKLGSSVPRYADLQPESRIERIAQHIGASRRICIIFDEIEYVSFLAKLDPHWHVDFVNLWQTLWSLQSEFRNFCYFIAGVNPTVVEVDLVNGVQNPLFGIVSYEYLTGLNVEELRRMLHMIGRRMGLAFEEDATRLLHRKYGGHPLLTRKACSLLHTNIQYEKIDRPVKITNRFIHDKEALIDGNMEFYFAHILTELEEFYSDEYEMLKMAVSGQKIDFAELANEVGFRKHLESYGLVKIDQKTKLPEFLIDCLRPFLERETARSERRRHKVRIFEGENRERWLATRTLEVVKELRSLDSEAKERFKYYLYANGGMFEPEEFVRMPSSNDSETFGTFINLCYRSLVEGVDKSGGAQNIKDLFFKRLSEDMPYLFKALHRIRVYRHWKFHGELNPTVREFVRRFFQEDLGEGNEPSGSEDFMVLQQIVLDELFLSIQQELALWGS